MATFKCPFCKGQVDVTAEVCPHCQCEVPESIKGFVKSSLHKVTGSGGPAANNQLRNIKVISNVIAFVILAIPTLLIIWGIRSCTSSVQEAANKPFVPTSFSAWEMCKQFSEKQLKAPSTADFAGESNSRITQLDTNTFRVISYVDAQNSFGAKLRTGFDCTVTYVGNDNWKLKNLEFGE